MRKLKRNIPMSFWKRQKKYPWLRKGESWTIQKGGYKYPKLKGRR